MNIENSVTKRYYDYIKIVKEIHDTEDKEAILQLEDESCELYDSLSDYEIAMVDIFESELYREK